LPCSFLSAQVVVQTLESLMVACKKYNEIYIGGDCPATICSLRNRKLCCMVDRDAGYFSTWSTYAYMAFRLSSSWQTSTPKLCCFSALRTGIYKYIFINMPLAISKDYRDLSDVERGNISSPAALFNESVCSFQLGRH